MRYNTLLLSAGLPGLALSEYMDMSPSFNWTSIAPTRDLKYHPCYDGFQCARLLMPLDWLNATADMRTVAIAVIKLPAVVNASDPSFAGPVLINPGGPGAGGVLFALGLARTLQAIIDSPGRRHYDIVSFDPRGLANSWPRADCFPDDIESRVDFILETRGHGALDGGKSSVPYSLALYEGLAERCLRAEANGLNGGEIMGYMSTPSVARDMVEIIDKIDELRKRETRGEDADYYNDDAEIGKRSRGGDDDVPRLQYLGFSYGTVLGIYFASLFPGRVGRMVLDGVADCRDYSRGPGWLTNTVDADELASTFFSGCHDAGPSGCALARRGDSSGLDIHCRFDEWLKALGESPLSSVTGSGEISVVDSRDIREVMASFMYEPPMFGFLAHVLNATMAGKPAPMVDSMDLIGTAPPVKGGRRDSSNTTDPYLDIDRLEGGISVRCADGDSVVGKNAVWWRRYVDKQVDTSSLMGALWSTSRLSCSAWPFRPNWAFKGPFTTPKAERTAEGATVEGKPAAPLLFLSPKLDPVTPLRAARAMAALHPGAGLVVQNSVGHCALTAGSRCTEAIVREYFASGRVPEKETICEVECGPWGGCALNGTAMKATRALMHHRRWFLLSPW